MKICFLLHNFSPILLTDCIRVDKQDIILKKKTKNTPKTIDQLKKNIFIEIIKTILPFTSKTSVTYYIYSSFQLL